MKEKEKEERGKGTKGCEDDNDEADKTNTTEETRLSKTMATATLAPAKLSTTSDPASLCNTCCRRAKNASFIHGQISHQVCCYPCAKRIFKERGKCPVCRRRIEKITRHISI